MARGSILIASYGRPGYLELAINSAIPVLDHDVEIIVADDFSSSSSLIRTNLLPKYRNTQISWLFHDRNVGMVQNWHSLIEKSNGRFLTFIGDDDILEPVEYLRALSIIEGYGAQAAIVGYNVLNAAGSQIGNISTRYFLSEDTVNSILGNLVKRNFSVYMRFAHPFTMIVHRDVYRMINYNDRVGIGADRLLLHQLFIEKMKVIALPNRIFSWRRSTEENLHYTSLSSSRVSAAKANILVACMILKQYKYKNNEHYDHDLRLIGYGVGLNKQEIIALMTNETGEIPQIVIEKALDRLNTIQARFTRLVVYCNTIICIFASKLLTKFFYAGSITRARKQ